jgi:uncharacterized phage protein (TIGR02220 family)
VARKKKLIVDYFPHDTTHRQTMFIIENKFGNDGYASWFKILELLGSTEGHFIDCNKIETWEFMLAKTRVSADILTAIMQTLSNLGAIDPILWSKKVIWSDNFISRISDAYSRRQDKLPDKNLLLSIYVNKNKKNASINGVNDNISTEREIEREIEREKESTKTFMYAEIIQDFNEVTNSHYKTDPVTKDIMQLINARIKEGFSIDDFKKVHRNKFASWGNDPKMKKFLRPHTLYTGKFQAYLNEQVSLSDQGKVSEILDKSKGAFKRFLQKETTDVEP